jgi:hypothetical protein
MVTHWPVIQDDSGPTKNRMAEAMSSATPVRPSGVRLRYWPSNCGFERIGLGASLWTKPGRTALTRTPFGPSSLAATLTSPSRPALDEQ